MNEKNKRACSRSQQEAPIRVLTEANCINLVQDKFNCTDAQMYNSNKAGIYFEMDHAIAPGQNVSIKVEAVEGEAGASGGAYTVHYGRVKWCRPIDAEDGQRYGIGAQIFETVLQARIV